MLSIMLNLIGVSEVWAVQAQSAVGIIREQALTMGI